MLPAVTSANWASSATRALPVSAAAPAAEYRLTIDASPDVVACGGPQMRRRYLMSKPKGVQYPRISTGIETDLALPPWVIPSKLSRAGPFNPAEILRRIT